MLAAIYYSQSKTMVPLEENGDSGHKTKEVHASLVSCNGERLDKLAG